MTDSHHHSTKHTVIGFGAFLLWASSVPLSKRCADEIGALTLGAVAYGLSGVLAFAYAFAKDRKSLNLPLNRFFVIRTLLFTSYLVIFLFALGLVERDKLPVVILLNYLWPSFTLIFSLLFFRTRVRKAVFGVGLLLVVAGLVTETLGERLMDVVSTPANSDSKIAFALATVAAVMWGFYSALNRKWGDRAGDTAALPHLFLIVSVTLFGCRFLSGETSSITPEVYLPLAYMCVIPWAANVCWDIGTRLGNIVVLSLVADGLPWISLTVSKIYLGVQIGLTTWMSAALIVFGALTLRWSTRPQR